MTLPIITHPNDAMLRCQTQLVDLDILATKETQTFLDQMIATMHANNGIGLAAPQVNHSTRICIINKEAFSKRFKLAGKPLETDLALINPIYEHTSKKHNTDIEMCLSIPGVAGRVKRWKNITVTAFDRFGTPITFEASAWLARVLQHEIDHLEGVLFIDRTNDLWEVEV